MARASPAAKRYVRRRARVIAEEENIQEREAARIAWREARLKGYKT